MKEKNKEINFSDYCFNFIVVVLFLCILFIAGFMCKIFFFTEDIQKDNIGKEYMDVRTIFFNNYEEGKNEKIEKFFTKNIKINNKLNKKDEEFLDSVFNDKNVVDKDSFIAAAKLAINYLDDKGIDCTTTKYSYKGTCNLINPLEKINVNYLYVDIVYDKKGTFFFTDDEFIITYIVL